MKYIIVALCGLGLGCQKTIHEARGNTPAVAPAMVLQCHC
jgi:hypothetical protein